MANEKKQLTPEERKAVEAQLTPAERKALHAARERKQKRCKYSSNYYERHKAEVLQKGKQRREKQSAEEKRFSNLGLL
jgi:hypothetical protein